MTNEKRLEIELNIVNKYMEAMTAAGWAILRKITDYGDGPEEDQGRRLSDEEHIYFVHADRGEDGRVDEDADADDVCGGGRGD